MNRYIILPSQKPDHWVCTDTRNGLVCTFKEHAFNETQQFTFLEDMPAPDPLKIARIANEMGAWLRAHHYQKAMP